jgi:hypothetical protein
MPWSPAKPGDSSDADGATDVSTVGLHDDHAGAWLVVRQWRMAAAGLSNRRRRSPVMARAIASP